MWIYKAHNVSKQAESEAPKTNRTKQTEQNSLRTAAPDQSVRKTVAQSTVVLLSSKTVVGL